MNKYFCTFFLMLFLTSCAPGPYSYYRPSVEGGELVSWGPNIIGPGNAVRFEGEIFELKIRYTGELQLELFVAEGHILYLDTPELHVFLDKKHAGAVYPVPFHLFGTAEPVVTTFEGMPRRNILQRNGSVFSARIETGKVGDTFRVRLPIFRSESGPVEFNDVIFTKNSGVAISPIN